MAINDETFIDVSECKKQLKECFLNLSPEIDIDALYELVNQFELVEFPKKYLLLKEGEFSDDIYFVCKGLIRNYYIKEDKEINHWITKENGLLSAAYTIATGDRNFINYETLEPTITLKISYSILLQHCDKHHSIARLVRKIIEKYYTLFMEKTYEVLFLSAEERYHIFMKDHSDLNARLPVKIIASYIGIAPETLSRLRAKQ